MAGKLWSVSASQVETFLKCPRAWFEGSVLGNRAPQTASQTRGVEVHAELEHYGTCGEVRPSPHIEIVQVALPYIPHPANDPYWKTLPDGYGLMLEQEIDMATYPGGPSWKGYMDRVLALPTCGEVWDYKTTSDFRYAKTPDELKHSPQMVSYAKWLADNSDYEEIWVKHLVLRMRGRAAAKLVEAKITRAEIEEEWKKVLQTVAEMARWGELNPKTSDVLPPNTDHCSSYGGCHYRPICGFENALVSIRRPSMNATGTGSSLLETMLKTASAVGVAPPAAAPVDPLAGLMGTPTPATVAPSVPTPAAVVAPLSGLASLLATATTVTPAPAPAGSTPVPVVTPVPAGILSSDAVSRVSTPEEVGPPPVIPGLTPEASAASVAPAVSEVPAEVTPTAAPAEAPKKGRGRPRKAASAEATGPAAPVVVGAPIAPEVVAAINTQMAEAVAAAGPFVRPTETAVLSPALFESVPGLVVGETKLVEVPAAQVPSIHDPDFAFACGCDSIFIDCLPQKGWPWDAPVWLDSIMSAFTRLAAASAKVSDYALIRYESKGHLRTAIKLLMAQLPKTVIVTTSTAGSAEFLECVTPYAKIIFRGIR